MTTRPPTSGSTPRSSRTSTPWPAPCRAGCAARCRRPTSPTTSSRRSRRRPRLRAASRRWCCPPTSRGARAAGRPPRCPGAGRPRCPPRPSTRSARCCPGPLRRSCSSAATRSPRRGCSPRPGWPRRPGPACCARPSRPGSRAALGCRSCAPLPYPPEPALEALAGTDHLVLVGARRPVAFFAYPGLPGTFAPPGCAVHVLAEPGEDATAALLALADRIAPDATPAVHGSLPAGAAHRTPHAEEPGAGGGRPAARGRHRGRRGADLRAGTCPTPPPGRPATTGSRSPAARSGRACRRRRARRSPAPTARSSACRPTAARCTRSPRCGRTRASGST